MEANQITIKDYENGYYFEPTIIEVSSNQMIVDMNQEESLWP